jgi:hypothetical protein
VIQVGQPLSDKPVFWVQGRTDGQIPRLFVWLRQDLSNLANWDRDNVVNINVLPRIYTLQCFSLCMLNGAYKHLLYTIFHNSYT